MFKVIIEYIEKELTRSEVEALAVQRYGSMGSVNVEFMPIDDTEAAMLDFVLDGIVTDEQSNALFGDKDLYNSRISSIKAAALEKVKRRLDHLIKHNEGRL